MNKLFGNDLNAVFEDDMHINEAFDEVFKQIYEQENEIQFEKLTDLWAEVGQSQKKVSDQTNRLFKNEGLQSSIESEMKALKEAESSLHVLKKRTLELSRQRKIKQQEILSSLNYVEDLIHQTDIKIEDEHKTLIVILKDYKNELQERKKKFRQAFFYDC